MTDSRKDPVKAKTRYLILAAALGTPWGGLPAQDAPRATRTAVDTSRSSLPAYQNTPTAKAGSSRKKAGAKTTPIPTPARTPAPGSSRR